MNANRRLRERKHPERIVSCKLGGEESSAVLNLSEDGLCFESLTPIEEKDLLQLRLSVDLNSAIEATGELAWIDSAKRTGGLRFLELSAPAREQIRAWLSEASIAGEETVARSCRSVIKQGDDGAASETPVIGQEKQSPSTQLVPIERYRAQTRSQFLRGVLVGFVMCMAVMIPIFRFAGGMKPGSPAGTAANRATQSSAEQTRASVVKPASRSASTSDPTATKPLATEPAAVQTAAAPAPAASKAYSSLGRMQPKRVPAEPQELWSALQAGNIQAAVALADLYLRGEGVPVNCQQARVLLLVASGKNNAEASRKLQKLDKGGCPAKSE
jgi:hypothetical protein